jgi:flagellar secretion chaperone FliS
MYARSYQRVQNETANPHRQLVLLFEAAQRLMQTGITSLEAERPAQASQALGKASDIVIELWNSLDPKRAPELCEQLGGVYEFVAVRLTQALNRRDAEAARQAQRAFAPLVDAFRQAVAQVEAA